MLTILLETAPQQPFTFQPVMIVAVVAAIALISTVLLLRFRRKGGK